MEDADGHFLRRWISLGDVVQIVVLLSVIAVSFGTLSARVDDLASEVRIMRDRDITPGAERRISILEVQVTQQRMDSAEWRKEVREQLDRIEAKVDAHAAGDRKSEHQ